MMLASNLKAKEVSAQEVIGKGYSEFWNSKKRYIVCKGSRGSKKSTTAALKIITKMMEYPLANTVVVRQVATTLEDSCFAQLKWAIDRLGVSQWWEATTHPLKIRYKPTGQKIIFRGLDDPLKTTSVTVDHGFLCWAWLEEAFEVDEDSFDTIDESLRGIMPDGYYVQWLITFNPWDANSWLKRRFFDAPDEDTLAMTTTYKCNEWLSDDDRRVIERAKVNAPDRYKVIGLGEWGLAEGQFFKQWRSDRHVIEPFAIPRGWRRYRAMDWGTAHPYACYWIACDYDDNAYVYRELYGWGGKPNVGTGETAKQVAEKIAQIEPADEQIYNAVLDNACWAKPGTTGPGIAEEINRTLYEHHRPGFNPSSKGRAEGANQIRQRLIGNTLADGTQKPALYVFANCIHLIRTLPMLAYDKRNPEAYDTDGEDHACLVAGTMVTTDKGRKAIENIEPGDMVKTSKGFHKVMNAGITGLDAEVFTVAFDDGNTITGTANHPVYVVGLGFIKIKDLYIGDEVEVEQCQENKQTQQTALRSMGLNSADTQIQKTNQMGGTTEQVAVTAKKESATFTMKFGNITTEKSPKDIMSITKTETPSIMIFPILNYFPSMNIYPCINMNDTKMKKLEKQMQSILNPLETKPKNGTLPRKGEHGIENMQLESQTSKKHYQRSDEYANSADVSLKPYRWSQTGQNIVQQNAMRNTDGKAELIMKIENVSCVGKSLAPINTIRERLARKSVTVCSVKKENRRANVYNLAVDGAHEFYANGIRVHNCDALAYYCMARPFAPTRPDKRKLLRPDGYIEQRETSAWTT